MIKPPPLHQGSTIGIVAPGRKVSWKDVDASLAIFKAWGLEVTLAPNLFSEEHPYLAGTDQQRLADFQQMVDSPTIEAIICARGGYGSSRFVDDLNCESLIRNPKWIVGFSDVTAIHLKLFSAGIQSIHGTMPILFSQPEARPSIESLKKVLFGEKVLLESNAHQKNKYGKVSGQVVGGNLSLIIDSLGTSNEVNTVGKILVIEEIDEYRYKVDRMINQLRRAGKLTDLAGLIVGHMTDMKDSTLPFGESVEEIILHHTKDFRYPIAFQFPTGHENPNLAWIQGASATLEVTPARTSLTFA